MELIWNSDGPFFSSDTYVLEYLWHCVFLLTTGIKLVSKNTFISHFIFYHRKDVIQLISFVMVNCICSFQCDTIITYNFYLAVFFPTILFSSTSDQNGWRKNLGGKKQTKKKKKKHKQTKKPGENNSVSTSEFRGSWAPLTPRFFQNHAVFRQFLGENPYFEQILGPGCSLKTAGPLTKILDPPLVSVALLVLWWVCSSSELHEGIHPLFMTTNLRGISRKRHWWLSKFKNWIWFCPVKEKNTLAKGSCGDMQRPSKEISQRQKQLQPPPPPEKKGDASQTQKSEKMGGGDLTISCSQVFSRKLWWAQKT